MTESVFDDKTVEPAKRYAIGRAFRVVASSRRDLGAVRKLGAVKAGSW